MSTTDNKKPPGTTMEGMIWRANDILTKAVSENFNGIPKNVAEECCGIFIISSVELGLFFTNSVGAGIVLAKQDGKWSLPCACTMSGLGFGVVIGGGHTDYIVFIMKQDHMDAFVRGNTFTAQNVTGLHVGELNRTTDFDIKDHAYISVSFSKGAFVGTAVEGADIVPRNKANDKFYKQECSAHRILYGPSPEWPTDKVTLVEEVYAKLDMLSKGETCEPSETEIFKVEAATKSAIEASEHGAKNDFDVVEVSNLEKLVQEEEKEAAA